MREFTREEVISRYENIVKRWNESKDLIRLFPDKYEDICRKLEALKNGMEFSVKYMTKEVVMDMGAKLCGVQQAYGAKNKMVREYKNDDYRYETDIPYFVDRCINSSLTNLNSGEEK